MRATGIVRRTDTLGRIVIPKEIRKIYGIAEGDPVEFYTTPDGIILKRYDMEGELINAVTKLNNAVDYSGDDLAEEKAYAIRQHICGIKNLLEMEE